MQVSEVIRAQASSKNAGQRHNADLKRKGAKGGTNVKNLKNKNKIILKKSGPKGTKANIEYYKHISSYVTFWPREGIKNC